MSEFDPDAFITQQQGASQPEVSDTESGKEFDPDAFIASNEESNEESDEEFNPDEFIKENEEAKYGTTGQQALTAIEGLGQGYAGPIATGAEMGLNAVGVPGFKPEDIAGRAETNPVIHGVSEAAGLGAGLVTGGGELGLISKGLNIIPKGGSFYTKLGSAALKGAIEMGAVQGGDEISKAMLGQGDPNDPVGAAISHIGAAMLIGGGTGGVFGVTGQLGAKALEVAESNKLGTKAVNIVKGIGLASEMQEAGVPPEAAENYVRQAGTFEDPIEYNDVKQGINLYQKGMEKVKHAAVKATSDYAGFHTLGIPGLVIADSIVAPAIEKILNKPIAKTTKYIYPAVLRAISDGQTQGLAHTIDYATKVSKGAAKMNSAVEHLFSIGGQQIVNTNAIQQRERLKELVEDNELGDQISSAGQPQGYADGGEVSEDPNTTFTSTFPEQAQLLSAAKSRIVSYLGSQRPTPPISQLPFDSYTEDPIKAAHYDRALDIANNPLGLLAKIKTGEVVPEEIQHMTQLYPEIYSQLTQKIEEKLYDSKIDEQNIPFKTLQGISMFLGKPLKSSFTPAYIQAAQSVYFTSAPPQQPAGTGKVKKKQALNKGPAMYKTTTQEAEADRSDRS